MKKEIKLLGVIGLFFVAAFLIVAHLISTTQKANNVFDFLKTNAQNHMEGEKFPSKYYNHPVYASFFRTMGERKENFASITLENVSPLFCSQILNRTRPFLVDVFLNDKPVFFGSDWRCFKGLNHKMRFQFEIYNYTLFFKMNEPKSCLDIWDCDVERNETCLEGYCQKTIP